LIFFQLLFKITGDSIFNLLKLNDFEIDENERPLYPPKILRVEVLLNPFKDIVLRDLKSPILAVKKEENPTKKQKKL
jgi:peptidyl-prolyl cis-trans isomerase SDCCAG10